MKKFIWISLLVLFVFSCGSRSVEKEKSFEQTKQETKTTETGVNLTLSTSTGQNETILNKHEISQEKQAENKSSIQDAEYNSQKTKYENNSKTLKRTEYYPNGQKKKEVETSENYSKVSDEKEFYKNRSQQLEKKLSTSIKVQDSIYKQNLTFAKKNEALIKFGKSTLSQLETTREQLKRSSERKGMSFGSVVGMVCTSFILGILFLIILKYLWKKIKKSQWYLNLISKILNSKNI